MRTGKIIALTRQTFVGKIMSLFLNMLSRLVITFLPRSKHLLISWLQSPSAVILEPPKKSQPLFWPPHANSWLIGKDSDAGRDWGQEKKGTTENEMAGWHPWLNGCEFEWTQRVGDGQGVLACCDSWGCKELHTTKRLNWTELNWVFIPLALIQR